jgi:ribosomal protein L7/L12
MSDAAPPICVALVVVVLAVGWMLGRRRANPSRGGDLVGDQLAARQAGGGPASPVDTAELEQRVRSLLLRRQKIQAIKLFREHTGVGLKEAKDAVERLEIGQPRWLPGWAPSAITAEVPKADLELVRALKRQGKLIEAIKTYRVLTGVGLKEAKDAVDLL